MDIQTFNALYGAKGVTRGKRIRVREQPVPGQMNKLEQQYSEHLKILLRMGEIEDFGFQRLKFRLADKTFYTPDFDVTKGGELQLHEAKGFWEEDARIKIKFAAATFWHFRWIAVRWVKKAWEYEEF